MNEGVRKALCRRLVTAEGEHKNVIVDLTGPHPLITPFDRETPGTVYISEPCCLRMRPSGLLYDPGHLCPSSAVYISET